MRSGISTLLPQIELSILGDRDITLRTPVSVLTNITTPILLCTGTSGAPSVNNRSAGSKVTLYGSLSATQLDYGIGVEGGAMWFSTPTSSNGFKFYSGLYEQTSIYGGTISCKNIDVENELCLGIGENKKTITSILNSKLSVTDPKLTQTAVAWTSNSVDSDGLLAMMPITI